MIGGNLNYVFQKGDNFIIRCAVFHIILISNRATEVKKYRYLFKRFSMNESNWFKPMSRDLRLPRVFPRTLLIGGILNHVFKKGVVFHLILIAGKLRKYLGHLARFRPRCPLSLPRDYKALPPRHPPRLGTSHPGVIIPRKMTLIER